MPTVTQLLAKVGIDLSDVLPGIAAAQTTIGGGISQATQQAQAGLNNLERSFNVLSATEAKAERDAIGLAQAQARLSAAQGDRAGGAATLRAALEQSVGLDERLNLQVQTQIVSLENARTSWQQFGDAASQNLMSVVAPAALLTTGIVALERAGQSFINAFKFKTTLDENVRSIEIQLQGIRDSGQAFAQAERYADAYKLTQQQVDEAMLSSVPVMRNTSASLEVILGVFDRLQMRQPGKTFQDAARAIGELQAGQIESIHKVFNVSADEANRMKKEIAGGADAIQVVSDYLDRTGLGMDALKAKTVGASGAMRDLQKANEDFTLAQAQWAQGPGMAILQEETTLIRGLTNLMSGHIAITDQSLHAWERYVTFVRGATTLDFSSWVRQRQEDAAAAAQQAAAERDAAAATENTAQATAQATQAQRDRVDISKLDEAALQRLHDALTSTGQRAADAWGKLNDAQRQYEQDGQQRLADHQQRLADIQQVGAERLAQIDSRYEEQRASADETYSTRTLDIRRGLSQRLADMEREYTEGEAEKRQAGAERLAEIDANLARQTLELRRNSGQRLTEIAQEIQQHQEDAARQAAERAQAYQERQVEQQQQLAQRLSDLEQQQLDRRTEAQQAYQDRVAELHQRAADLEQQALDAEEQRARDYAERVADIRARSAERAADAAREAAERAADDAQRWQDAEQDRAQQHADRIEELRRRLEGGGAATFGRTTTLTGQTFTTQMTGGADTGDRARLEEEIRREEERYQREEQRAAQAEARRREREQRDLARQAEQAARQEQQAERQAAEQLAREERQATERLAQQEQTLTQQQSALDQNYAQQEQRAAQAAERQRQILERQFAEQQAAAERARARQEQQAAEQDAREIAHLQQQLARERTAEAQREADARSAADRGRADLEAQLTRDAATRARHYAEQRTKATEAANEQLADAQRAYVRQLADLAKTHDQQRAEQEKALREQIAKEADSYVRQEEQRAAAFAKQKTQLEQAMGEQIEAYTEAQRQLGIITQTEADRRDRIIEDSYLHQAQAQRAAFDQFFSGLTGPSGEGVTPSWVYNGGASGPNAPASVIQPISIGNITLPNVTNPSQFIDELRQLVIQRVRANGGDANAYWGGS